MKERASAASASECWLLRTAASNRKRGVPVLAACTSTVGVYRQFFFFRGVSQPEGLLVMSLRKKI